MEIDPMKTMRHLHVMGIGLPNIMLMSKRYKGSGPGCVCLGVRDQQIEAGWAPVGEILDKPFQEMAGKSHAGDMSRISVVIFEPDGSRAGYLINCIVSWLDHNMGFAVMEEHYVPPPPPTPPPIPSRTALIRDVFDKL